MTAPTANPAAYLKAAREIEAAANPALRPLKLAVLSSYTAEFLRPYLIVEGAARGLALQPWFAPWGQLEEQLLNPGATLYAEQPEAIVLLVRLEDLAPELLERFLALDDRDARLDALVQRAAGWLAAIRRQSSAQIFLSNFSTPIIAAGGLAEVGQAAFLQRANDALAAACRAVPGAHVFDYARLVAEHGARGWVDTRLFAMARLPYGVAAQIAVARRLARCLRAAVTPPAKVLVLDLDNTLWGGVLGEDGIGGIKLDDEYPGNIFKNWQRYLRTLRDRGVLLALCSKNNESDVAECFARHADLQLRREDFAASRVNWLPKSENLRAIARELNIGADALVFLDDSAFEREEVRQNAPEVRVLDFPASPLGLIEAVEDSGHFDTLALSDEDRRRAELYREQSARVVAEQSAASPEDFLRSLELVATIGHIGPDELPRVEQLLGKTNQFNLTTRRHSAAEIQSLLASGGVGLWLRLADKFGDHGLVGVALAGEKSGRWEVDTFLMSCRVIGRGVETALLAELAREAAARGARELDGVFLATAKNQLVAQFFPTQGFTEIEPGTRWRRSLAEGLASPDFLRIVRA